MAIGAVSSSSVLIAQSRAASERSYETSMERVATGSRLNQASDNPTGVVQVNGFQAQINMVNTALRTGQKASVLNDTVGNGLASTMSILTKMSDLITRTSALQSGDAAGRSSAQSEYNSLVESLGRLVSTTKTGSGSRVLDGSLSSGKAFFVTDQATGSGDNVIIRTGSVAASVLGSSTLKLADVVLTGAGTTTGSSGGTTTTTTGGGVVGGLLGGTTTTTTTGGGSTTAAGSSPEMAAAQKAIKDAMETVSGYVAENASTKRTLTTRMETLNNRLQGSVQGDAVITKVDVAAERTNAATQKITMQRQDALYSQSVSRVSLYLLAN